MAHERQLARVEEISISQFDKVNIWDAREKGINGVKMGGNQFFEYISRVSPDEIHCPKKLGLEVLEAKITKDDDFFLEPFLEKRIGRYAALSVDDFWRTVLGILYKGPETDVFKRLTDGNLKVFYVSNQTRWGNMLVYAEYRKSYSSSEPTKINEHSEMLLHLEIQEHEYPRHEGASVYCYKKTEQPVGFQRFA